MVQARDKYSVGNEYPVRYPSLLNNTTLYVLNPNSGRMADTRVPGTHGHTSSSRNVGLSKDVLVVEDETYLCELIADVLEADGHTARTAANGKEALERISERKPQIILLDLMMPVMDGCEFMRVLRANPDWRDVPVVLVTAVYDIKRTQQETGAVAVLTKPFDIDRLTEVVAQYSI